MVNSKEKEVVCIRCPLGCRGAVVFDGEGKVARSDMYQCKEGKQYAETEGNAPIRVFTGTVLTNSNRRVLLPVRSNKPIPKESIIECARLLSQIKVTVPIKVSEVIVPDIMHSGANIISSTSLDN